MKVLFETVAVESAVSSVPDPEGPVSVVPSVPAIVIELDARKVLVLSTVRVELVAGAVMASLLTEVAVATPIFGVVKTGETCPGTAPEPVVELNELRVSCPPPAEFV